MFEVSVKARWMKDKTGHSLSSLKKAGLRKFWPDLEISEAFLIGLEFSF